MVLITQKKKKKYCTSKLTVTDEVLVKQLLCTTCRRQWEETRCSNIAHWIHQKDSFEWLQQSFSWWKGVDEDSNLNTEQNCWVSVIKVPEHVDLHDVCVFSWVFFVVFFVRAADICCCVMVYVMAVTYPHKGCLGFRKLRSSSKDKLLLAQYWEMAYCFLCMHWNVFFSLQVAIIKLFLNENYGPTVYKVNLQAVEFLAGIFHPQCLCLYTQSAPYG